VMHLEVLISVVLSRRNGNGCFRSCFNDVGHYKSHASFTHLYLASQAHVLVSPDYVTRK